MTSGTTTCAEASTVCVAAGRDGSAVPVPRALWLETDAAHLERPFFVMERIDGCESQPQALLDAALEPHRATLGRRMYEVLAAIAAAGVQGALIGGLGIAGDLWQAGGPVMAAISCSVHPASARRCGLPQFVGAAMGATSYRIRPL